MFETITVRSNVPVDFTFKIKKGLSEEDRNQAIKDAIDGDDTNENLDGTYGIESNVAWESFDSKSTPWKVAC